MHIIPNHGIYILCLSETYTNLSVSVKFKTFNKLLVCKAHWADPRTGTALFKNI